MKLDKVKFFRIMLTAEDESLENIVNTLYSEYLDYLKIDSQGTLNDFLECVTITDLDVACILVVIELLKIKIEEETNGKEKAEL